MIRFFSKLLKRQDYIAELCSLKAELSETQQRLQRSLMFRHELAVERQMRKRLVSFLQKKKNTVITQNPDGTYTHTITSFVPDFSLLFVTQKELGNEDTP